MRPMRRFVILTLAVCTLIVGGADSAHAQRKTAGKDKAAPTSQAIATDMSDISWGMSMKQLVEYFTKKIDDKYRPLVAKANTAMKEDQLRAKKRNEIQKIHDSVVRFDGRKTGWDVSFLKGEFTHGNDESLVVVRDDNSQNFYFFIQNRLWKWYKAFDASVFQGADFAQFAQAIQGRYGNAVERSGEATPGAGSRQWLEWQDKATRLRAIDQTGFYGFYCLVFDDKDTLRRLPELRRVTEQKDDGHHQMVEHVTGDEPESDDVHQDVADRITGRIRRRPAADESKGKNATKGTRAASAPPAPTVEEANDPLRGL